MLVQPSSSAGTSTEAQQMESLRKASYGLVSGDDTAGTDPKIWFSVFSLVPVVIITTTAVGSVVLGLNRQLFLSLRLQHVDACADVCEKLRNVTEQLFKIAVYL